MFLNVKREDVNIQGKTQENKYETSTCLQLTSTEKHTCVYTII